MHKLVDHVWMVDTTTSRHLWTFLIGSSEWHTTKDFGAAWYPHDKHFVESVQPCSSGYRCADGGSVKRDLSQRPGQKEVDVTRQKRSVFLSRGPRVLNMVNQLPYQSWWTERDPLRSAVVGPSPQYRGASDPGSRSDFWGFHNGKWQKNQGNGILHARMQALHGQMTLSCTSRVADNPRYLLLLACRSSKDTVMRSLLAGRVLFRCCLLD